MASYQIRWNRAAAKEFRKLPPSVQLQILPLVEKLAEDPFPPGCRKLVGTTNAYRIRAGRYRVVYHVYASILVIEVVRVSHRKDVYRRR